MRADGKRQRLGVQPRRWPTEAPVLTAPSPVTAAVGAGAAAARGAVVPRPHLGDEPAALARLARRDARGRRVRAGAAAADRWRPSGGTEREREEGEAGEGGDGG